MKKIFFLSLLALSACAAKQAQPPKRIGMPNPASAHCVQQGGKLEIRNTPKGQVGMCHLSDGRICEEWALYRDNRCVATP
ncbi:putative hemolysin [Kozakia baliensis]|uniref:putative hemolysin n=1 Tax=Kozakia baliensis TaxID=153496 RepID=UPI000494FD2F|nr:DUF333 domain-containing protein [Kozakia baliensis]AOX20769.1 hemolysin [Kozakia baliensis]